MRDGEQRGAAEGLPGRDAEGVHFETGHNQVHTPTPCVWGRMCVKCGVDPLVHLRQCPTFKEWPDEVIHQLCKHSKIEEVSEQHRRWGLWGTPKWTR